MCARTKQSRRAKANSRSPCTTWSDDVGLIVTGPPSWPDRRIEELGRLADEGGPVTVGPATALHVVHGERLPLLVSILSSSPHLTAGTFSLRGGSRSEPERHPGDEVVFALAGRLNVHLPESGDWFN